MSDSHDLTRERHLARAVRSIAILARQFDRVAQELGLSLSQYRLLLFVRVRPQRASELAERASVKRPTLTALVDGLVESGYLRRLTVDGDRRGIRLELTEAGRSKLSEVERRLAAHLAEVTCLATEETVLEGLEQLSSAVEKSVDARLATPDPDPSGSA